MKQLANFRSGLVLATGVGLGLLLSGVSGSLFESVVPQGHAQHRIDQQRHQDERDDRAAIAERFAKLLASQAQHAGQAGAGRRRRR